MGRANPSGTGTLALVVELALILIAMGDVVFLAISRVWSAECVTGSV